MGRRRSGRRIAIYVDPFRKHCLLNGLDDIGMTMERAQSIDSFESADRIAPLRGVEACGA